MRTLQLIVNNDIESRLKKYKKLDQQIKTLEKERSELKDSLINDYFITNKEYKNDKGLILARYECHERTFFNQEKFKCSHSELYDEFSTTKPVYTFKPFYINF